MSSKVRQFPFHELETISRDDVELHNRALAMVGGANTTELGRDLTERLSETLGRSEIRIDFAGLVLHTIPPSCDMTAWRGFLHHPKTSERALAVLDSSLVDDWLRWALEDDEVRLGAPPGARDWGALGYVCLEVLQLLSKRGVAPMMLDTTPPLEAAVERYMARHRTVYEFCWIVGDQRVAGWFRLYVPSRWLQAHLDEAREPALDAILDRPNLERVRLRFDAILGSRKVEISAVTDLGPGDIIFTETQGLRGVDGIKAGASNALLRNGHASFVGYIEAGDVWTFKITNPKLKSESEMEEDLEPTDNVSEPNETTQSLNASALQTAQVDVDIRVGSAELSVAELARVQEGQILELDRKVGDLVDIMVDGRVHGQGELVNVEGAVGVRVISLAGR